MNSQEPPTQRLEGLKAGQCYLSPEITQQKLEPPRGSQQAVWEKQKPLLQTPLRLGVGG